MRFNKTVAKAFVFALGLGAVSFLGGYTAKAASPSTAPKLVFKGTSESIKATNGKFWGIAKEVNEKKANLKQGEKYYFVSELQPVGNADIDLSNFDKKKKLIIAVGADESFDDAGKWAIKEIAPQSKALKAIYLPVKDASEVAALGDANVGFLKLMNGDVAMTLGTDNEKIQVKKGFGKWETLKVFTGGTTDADTIKSKLEVLTQKGTLLTFRLSGVDDSDDGTTVGTWASAETKLKIPAKPAAPKVKVDSVKEVITLKDGQEYQVTVDTTAGNWTAAESKKYTFTDLGFDKEKNNTLKVRTKAKDKKLLSKEVTLSLKKQTAPTLVNLSPQGGNLIAPTGGMGIDVSLKVPYDIRKGAEITNGSATAYEFYFSGDGSAPTAETKWTKLPAGKQADGKRKARPAKVALKYSADKKSGTYSDTNTSAKIYVRLAGGKQIGNEVSMASAHAEKAFAIANQEQVATITGNNAAADAPNGFTSTINSAKGGVTLKYNVAITNVLGNKATLRTKLKGVSGISAKGSKVKVTLAGGARTGNGTATIDIKVSKNAFKGKEGTDVVADVEYSVQSVKKNLKITFKVPALARP